MSMEWALLLAAGVGQATVLAEEQAEAGSTRPEAQEQPADNTVVVTGYRSERLQGIASAGVLGNRPVLDTPFSVSTFTSEDIDNRMVISLSELLKDDPSITPTYAGNSFQDGFTVRGFDAGVSTLGYYGLFGLVAGRQPFETLDRVEVFKGPTATINGRAGNVGGTINLVPKTPTAGSTARVTGQYVSHANFEARGDISRRFGAEEQFGVRVNAAVRDGDTAIDFIKSRLYAGALALQFRTQTFEANVIADYSDGRYGAFNERLTAAPTLTTVPRAPDLNNLLTQPWTFREIEQRRIVGRANWRPVEALELSAADGHAYSTAYTLSVGQNRILNAAGDLTQTPNVSDFDFTGTTAELTARLNVELGPVALRPFVTGNYIRERQDNASLTLPARTNNIYRPVYGPRPTFTLPAPNRLFDEKTRSIVVGNELVVSDGIFSVIGAYRFLGYERQGFNQLTGVPNAPLVDVSASLPTVAVIVKPMPRLTIYANYIEAFENGGIAPITAANAFATLPPTISNQYEIGAKYGSARLGATVAAFRIKRQTSFVDPATNVFGAVGDQVHAGVEMTVNGEPIRGVRLALGATFIDPEVRNAANPAFNGNDPIGVAHFQGSASAEVDLPFLPGLTVQASAFHAGRQFADLANLQQLPRYTRIDVGVRHVTDLGGNAVTFRASVNNIADRNYYQGAGGGFLILGVPRTVLASVSVDF